MVSRAMPQNSNRMASPCASAIAECNAWVLPRKVRSWARAAARSVGLEKRISPNASVWSAPSTRRFGCRAAIVRAFSRASSAATAPGSRVPASRSIARSSISAGCVSTGMPALLSTMRRISLFEASTRGRSARQNGIATPTAGGGARPAGSARPRRFPRSSGGSRRSTASCAWRRACARPRLLRPRPCGRCTGRRRYAH